MQLWILTGSAVFHATVYTSTHSFVSGASHLYFPLESASHFRVAKAFGEFFRVPYGQSRNTSTPAKVLGQWCRPVRSSAVSSAWQKSTRYNSKILATSINVYPRCACVLLIINNLNTRILFSVKESHKTNVRDSSQSLMTFVMSFSRWWSGQNDFFCESRFRMIVHFKAKI